ncbi:hypothetical protein [Stenotrophomonas sp. BIGb0135]|uniref:hypothetical protein n=1 Tax=Stenotrophomonas sp. BIGb0135 TaxID=2940620 RepID=UPI002167DD2A|nr:hypothetical protein [Stenotrophomonas sp. BIGb0135]MCS4234434.1 hypothetical protein [Stenotrophomonas sp. BIGb0135]
MNLQQIDAVPAIIAILSSLVLVCVSRGFWANNRTYSERMEIIGALRKLGWPMGEEGDYKRVEYHDHYREVFWGRDPLRLYSPRLVAIIKAYRSAEASA